MIFYKLVSLEGRCEAAARACRKASGAGGWPVSGPDVYEALSDDHKKAVSESSFRGTLRYALERGYLVQPWRGVYRPSPQWCEEADRVDGLRGMGLV